jgi:hypothetical protein
MQYGNTISIWIESTLLQAALNVELRAAVKAGDLEEVKKLIKEGADVTTPMPDHIIPEDDVQVTLH